MCIRDRREREREREHATQLASKPRNEEILKGVWCSISNCDLQRIHMINKKYIINIGKRFHLNVEAVKHPSDPVSIEARVRDLKTSVDTPLPC